jgi:hypothetical protein
MADTLDTERAAGTNGAAGATTGRAPAVQATPTIPTQRVQPAPTAPAAAPATRLLPTQRGPQTSAPAPSDLPEPSRSAPGTRLRTVLVVSSIALMLGGLAAGLVLKTQADARATARAAAEERVALAFSGHAQEVAFDAQADERVAEAATTAARTAAYTKAGEAVAHATATLGATPQAGDAPRAELQKVLDAVSAAVAAGQLNPTGIESLAGGLAAPEKAATDAQAAWQAAEDARIAAEKAAAERAAAAAAAARRSTAAPRSSTPRAATSGAAAPAPAVTGIPAGGLVCSGAGGSGAESSVGAIGDAINAYRASQGLPTLNVVRSGSLVQHAITMAIAGGIWHSGGDNIVGCSNGGLGSLMAGWKGSPPHNAAMLKDGVSTMYVGGASGAGFLFGAVLFK